MNYALLIETYFPLLAYWELKRHMYLLYTDLKKKGWCVVFVDRQMR